MKSIPIETVHYINSVCLYLCPLLSLRRDATENDMEIQLKVLERERLSRCTLLDVLACLSVPFDVCSTVLYTAQLQ